MTDLHGHRSCFPIPPVVTVRATFTAHGDRLSGPLPSFPFRLQPGFPGYRRRSGTLRHLISCGPSPCDWLSQSLSTMTTLTAGMSLGGFLDGFPIPTLSLSFASHVSSPMFPRMDVARQLRWRFPKDPFALLALPTTAWGNARCVHALKRSIFDRFEPLDRAR